MSEPITTGSADETMRLAARFASLLEPGDTLALDGALGAGKTCFVRGLARGLGLDPRLVSSPTFVIVQEYQGPGARCTLIHIDAYRIHSPEELESAGIEDMWASDAVVAIEWPDRIEESLPSDRADLLIEHVSETQRAIRCVSHGSPAFRQRLDAAWKAARRACAAPSSSAGRCPICGQAVAGEERTNPFCSERCRMIDLGRWLDERYVVSREPARDADEHEGDV
ncbi:MAG: tRNA (adenosine(37)-N6)-threonylcarbamoyltransferase complex ATPase subunit type 1 TsaE [Phycisphaerales bacterium]|nr:tRNA (adenosine(37)-N6)-threonylcarbamoyltransferase complex ATPase subunit type 1 TsaE [Phycisphaerales bacterium]